MSGSLLQLSGIVVDLVHRVDHLPAPGEEVETSEFRMTAGGGFNAMAAARRMGVHVSYGGMLGQARQTTDAPQRRALYAQATQRMCEESPVIFLFTQPVTYAASNRITWQARGDDWLRASDISPR